MSEPIESHHLRYGLCRGFASVSHLPTAVVFVGPRHSSLTMDDSEVQFAASLAERIARDNRLNAGIRIAANGVIDEAITPRVPKDSFKSQTFLMANWMGFVW
jgi:hypothetical protein